MHDGDIAELIALRRDKSVVCYGHSDGDYKILIIHDIQNSSEIWVTKDEIKRYRAIRAQELERELVASPLIRGIIAAIGLAKVKSVLGLYSFNQGIYNGLV